MLNKIILHIRVWNQWRKHNLNSKLHKFLALIGWTKSPTMLYYYYCVGFDDGIKEEEKHETD